MVNSVFSTTVLLLLAFMISACSENRSTTAAPIDSVNSLEKLAQSYKAVSDRLPGHPQQMPPRGKREFVEQVFQEAGYDYSTTLIALSRTKLDPFNANQRDLAQLLFLPLETMSETDYPKLFEDHEIKAIREIQKTFR